MKTIGIVGGGLFGQIIGLTLSKKYAVCIIDGNMSGSGFAAAGCLIKPSWVEGIPRKSECYDLLNSIGDLREIEFEVQNPVHTVKTNCYALNKVALTESVMRRITWINANELWSTNNKICVSSLGDTEKECEFNFDVVLHCKGGFGDFQRPRFGMSMEAGRYYADPDEVVPTIKPYRPFTQLVKFIMPGSASLWAGDGTAKNEFNSVDMATSAKRISKFVGLPEQTKYHQTVGRRPYPIRRLSKDEGALIHQPHSQAPITVTGGAKNGTMGAAWAAVTLMERLA